MADAREALARIRAERERKRRLSAVAQDEDVTENVTPAKPKSAREALAEIRAKRLTAAAPPADVTENVTAPEPTPTPPPAPRVPTKLLDRRGLTGADVKRAAAEGGAISPTVEASLLDDLKHVLSAGAVAVPEALAGVPALALDAARYAGAGQLGAPALIAQDYASGKLLPATNAVQRWADKTIETMGAGADKAPSLPAEVIAQLLRAGVNVAMPVAPGVKVARTLSRPQKVIAFYEKKIAEAASDVSRKGLIDEMVRTVTSMAEEAPAVASDVAEGAEAVARGAVRAVDAPSDAERAIQELADDLDSGMPSTEAMARYNAKADAATGAPEVTDTRPFTGKSLPEMTDDELDTEAGRLAYLSDTALKDGDDATGAAFNRQFDQVTDEVNQRIEANIARLEAANHPLADAARSGEIGATEIREAVEQLDAPPARSIGPKPTGPRAVEPVTPGAKEPWQMTRAEFADHAETTKALKATYFSPDGTPIASSREAPFRGESLPLGTWRMDPTGTYDKYGDQIEQLRELPVEKVAGAEDPFRMGRGGDVDRYAAWTDEGLDAPPITALEMTDGTFRIYDGHRRLAAAQKAGRATIRAWVAPEGLTDLVEPSGKPITTNLTHQLAVRQALAEGKPVPPEVRAEYPDLLSAAADEAKATKLYQVAEKAAADGDEAKAAVLAREAERISERAAATAAAAEAPVERFPVAGEMVDGRAVRQGVVPNTDSIRSSLDEFEVLPGIREVRMSEFDGLTGKSYSKSETERIARLAAEIEAGGEVEPLIVVDAPDGPYILEGGHRAEALYRLNAKSFPALVVRDLSEGADDLARAAAQEAPRPAVSGMTVREGRPTAPPTEPPAATPRVPSERPGGFTTSNKNAVVDAERAERGLPPMMTAERQSNPDAWDGAMRMIDQNPQVQDELIAELSQQARAVTPTENALLLHRRVDLRNEHEKALLRWKAAFDSGDEALAATESARIKSWSGRLADLEDVTKAVGTESGRSLQARKMMANEDFSLAQMEVRAMEAKGRDLTPVERNQLIEAQERITKLQSRIDALEAERVPTEIETATTEAMRDVKRRAGTKPTGGTRKGGRGGDAETPEDAEAAIIGRIQAKFDKDEAQSITPLVQKLARMLWERGVRTQAGMIDELHDILRTIDPNFTRDQTQRAFSGYGDYRALSKEEIDVGLRDLKGQTQQILKLEALEARRPLEKTGVERRAPSDLERRLIKQVNELKRKFGVVVTDPETQLKGALQARKTYYEHRIADLKYEIETRSRIVKEKSPSPRDAELDAMIAERDRLQVEHDAIFPKREVTDEQRLKSALAVAERNRAQWETRLADAEVGVFSSRVPGRKVTSPELEQIRAETAAIREHVKELRDLANPKRTPEERALQALKTRMTNQTLDYQKRLAEGDFVPRVRRTVPLDAEAARLKAERDTAKDAFNAGLEKDRWERSSVFEKTKARAWGVYDLMKTLMASGEFSFVLRQGKMNFLEALTSPKRAVAFGKAIRDGIRSMRNPLTARIVEQEMISDPLYAQMLRDKLYVPPHASKLSLQEEFALGRYSSSIPGIAVFNRAGEEFLKRLRFENYKIMVKSMTETGAVTPEEGRVIAAFINEQTGRGGLGAAEPAAVVLNRVFFSPRYLMSRLQLASGHQLWSGKWAGTGRARKAVAESYARMLIGGAAYYTALMMFFDRDDKATVQGDFRSSEAGKIRIGNTRLDPMAGLAQTMTFMQRTITGETKDSSGKVVPIVGDVPYGRDDWTGYAARFARSKAHPAVGAAIDLRLKKNIVGETVTVTSKLAESGPMTYYDIYAALREQDVPDGLALSMLAMLGEGLQTYAPKPSQQNSGSGLTLEERRKRAERARARRRNAE